MSVSERQGAAGRLGWALPAALLAVAALPFVLDIDAQWLKLDDFSTVEDHMSRPLGTLVADVMLTRTTPHVRFAFLEQLLFLPFFRWGALDRSMVNVVFLIGVFALVGAGAALASTARPGARLAWSGAFVAFLPAIWNVRAWNTLEFKTALYLPFSFAFGAALVALSWRIGRGERRAGRGAVALWILLALASFHMAEVTLAAVAAAGLGLVLRRRLPVLALVFVSIWPILYWGANKLIVPRPLGLLAEGKPGALATSLANVWFHAHETFPVFAIAAGVAALAALAMAASRGFLRSVPELLWIFALPASGLLLTLLSLVNSFGAGLPRYIPDRHALYIELCLSAGVALSVAWIAAEAPRRLGGALAVAALALGGTFAVERVQQMAAMAEIRRAELTRTFALGDAIRKRPADRETLVLISDWPDGWAGKVYADPTFLGAQWAREDYVAVFGCPIDRCGPLGFVVNAGWVRTPMNRQEREALCDRAARAEVLAVTREGGPAVVRPPAGAACLEWLEAGKFVDPAPEPAASTAAAKP